MGVMLIVFMPLPYVDASWSSAFPEKGRRMFVGAAGIIVDILLASVALIVWALAEPGTVRAVAYNVIFVAGLSTLLLNGNPLLRFDSYYILADYLEIPNMADRANKYLGYLIKRYCLAHKGRRLPRTGARREALAVRLCPRLLCLPHLHLRRHLPLRGRKVFRHRRSPRPVGGLFHDRFALDKVIRHVAGEMREHAPRAAVIAAAVVCPLLAFIVWFPLPSSTVTEGVVWVPEDSQVFAGADGFVVKVLASPGQRVSRGDPLFFCDAPDLKAEMKVLEASLKRWMRASGSAS